MTPAKRKATDYLKAVPKLAAGSMASGMGMATFLPETIFKSAARGRMVDPDETGSFGMFEKGAEMIGDSLSTFGAGRKALVEKLAKRKMQKAAKKSPDNLDKVRSGMGERGIVKSSLPLSK